MRGVVRCVVTYLIAMFLVSFGMALFIPTDVPPVGAVLLSWWKESLQMLTIYGIPAVLVFFDLKYFRSEAKSKS